MALPVWLTTVLLQSASAVIGVLSRGEVERIVVRAQPGGRLPSPSRADVLRSLGVEWVSVERRDPHRQLGPAGEDSYPGG